MDSMTEKTHGDCTIKCAPYNGAYTLTVLSPVATYEASIDSPVGKISSVVCKETHASVKCGIVTYKVPLVEKDPLKVIINQQKREIEYLRDRVENLEETVNELRVSEQYFWFRSPTNVERPSMTAVLDALIRFSKFRVVLNSVDWVAYGKAYSSKDVNTPRVDDTSEIKRIEVGDEDNLFTVYDVVNGVLKSEVYAKSIRFWGSSSLLSPPFCVVFYN